MAKLKITKKDPPGTRIKDGRKYIPPAPMKRNRSVGVGNYRQDVDVSGEAGSILNSVRRKKR